MKEFFKNLSYPDFLFAFLSISLFITFLMPFEHYFSLNLVDISSSSTAKFKNDLLAVNMPLFKGRYHIFYYTLCISSLAILLNSKLVQSLLTYFFSFSRVIQITIYLFFIFGIVSSCFAVSPSIAFKGVSVTFLQFISVLFIAWYVQYKDTAVRDFYVVVMLSLIFFGGALALQLLLSNFSIYDSVIIGNIQENLLYMYNCLNPRFLDNYLSWFIPLLLLAWFVDLRPIYKLGSFVALVVVWFVLINHAFRTIFAEYLIVLPLLFIFSRRYFFIAVKIIALSIVVAVALDMVYKNFIMAIPNADVATFARYTSSGRITLWKEAFNIGLTHPLTGVGQWNYFAVTKNVAGYPHNILLEIWSQWGIPAFICATVVIITCIKNLWKKRKQICINPYQCIFIMMLTTGMVDSMFNAMFKTSLGLFGSIFVFGFCLSIFKPQNNDGKEAINSLAKLIIYVCVVASIFCIAILPFIFPPMWI